MKILVINPCKKEDYLATSIIEGLKKTKHEIYYTDEGNGADNIINDSEFIYHSKNCDYIFAIWGKSKFNGIKEPKFYLIDKVNGWDKTIYIDGSEYNYTGFRGKTNEQLDPTFKSKARYYFKRECLKEHIDQGIIPLPFATLDSYFNNDFYNKEIDVFCSYGQLETGLRKQSIEVCNQLKDLNRNIQTENVSDYFVTIKKSLISVDAFGGGECNARMWQIMANKSCLFAQMYNIIIPNLEDGVHYVSWNSREELKDKIIYYLNNKNELEKVINESYKNIILNHSSEKRVEYILNLLNKN